MKLILLHVPNPDIDGGYWTPPVEPNTRQLVTVRSLAEARDAYIEWRDRNGLGGGNIARDCGTVLDDAGKAVARFSYNGRAWEPGEYPTPEILIE